MSPVPAFIIAPLVALLALLLAGCGDNMITQPGDVIFPDTNVSFRAHVQPFLAVSCGVGGCHSDVNPAGRIRLTSYTTLMFDRANLVVPNRPDESLIIQVLDGVFSHPWGLLQERINANHRRGMRQWVLEGALNN
ncbi:MAG: hypothetical protein RL594_524 [Bacteroidota bacterium]|jgi:hypothetical protein